MAFWISFYELYTLCQFGRINNNITILLSCIIFILAGFVTLIIRTVRRRSITPKKDYGKNAKGETESYLITYNSGKSENITIYLNGYVNADYNDDKLLEPLIDTMKVIPLNKTVSSWPENQYAILYSGKRSFGYNSSNIIYIDSNGNTKSPVNTNSEIVGYFVSVYVSGKENTYTPVRYSLTDSSNNTQAQEPSQDNKKNSSQSYSSADEAKLIILLIYPECLMRRMEALMF